jgi:hypothetical protein
MILSHIAAIEIGNVKTEDSHAGRCDPLLYWSMYMGRMREVISVLVASFPWTESEASNKEPDQEIEQLAESILEHGRMTQNLYPSQKVVVDVKELAYRFREKPRTITKALLLLENQDRARHTDLHGLWQLYVTSPERPVPFRCR